MDKWLICFDLDGLYFTEQSFQKFKENLAPNIEKAQRDMVLALSNQMHDFKLWILSEEEYRDWAKKELWLVCTNEEIYTKLRESYEVNEKVEQLAKKLRQKGYKTGICSNNFPSRIRELENKFHFLENFDVHIFSFEVGFMKPDSRIFQILIDKSGIGPNQIIYSDDKEDKIQWAKSLWIQTFVFHSFDEFIQDLKKCWIEIE
jgi:epoxide hydrolase-like predicted phosphatase